MENRIVRIDILNVSVVPATAELRLRVEVERVTPTTELRGRMMGPHCRFASTIEVAYPVRNFPSPSAERGPPSLGARARTTPNSELDGRVVIPEASLWDPQSPFLYHGPVELWQDGRLCQRLTVTHGLRTLALTPRGLHVNGRKTPLHGRSLMTLTDAEALTLREAGVNLLVVPIRAETESLWDLADRIGFLMLGRIVDDSTAARAAALSTHACCLGWLAEVNGNRPTGYGLLGAAGSSVAPGLDFALGADGVLRGPAGEFGTVEI